MANIYQKQATSDFANKTYSHEGNSGQWAMKEGEKLVGEGEKTEEKAQNTYKNALTTQWQTSMNDLASNPKYASNPQALQEESKKLTEKMAGDIVDDDVKVDFLVNAQIKSGAYYKNALANRIRIDDENRKLAALNNAYAGIDFVGKTISNGISGTADVDDLFAANETYQGFENSLTIRNPDGSFVFTPEQQISLREKMKKNKVDAFSDRFSALPSYQQNQVYEELKKGDVFLGFVNTKDGKKSISLKDIFNDDEIQSVKSNAQKSIMANQRARLNEIKLQRQEAYLDFYDNPTIASFNRYKELNPEAKQETLDLMEDVLKATPEYQVEQERMNKVLEVIDGYENATFKDEDEKFNTVANLQYALTDLNQKKMLTPENMEAYRARLIRMVKDKEYKAQYDELAPHLNAYNGFWERAAYLPINLITGGLNYQYRKFEKSKTLENRLQNMYNEAVDKAFTLLDAGNPKEAINMLKDAKKHIVWVNEPEFQGKDVGDIVVQNGIAYTILDFADGSALLELKK